MASARRWYLLVTPAQYKALVEANVVTAHDSETS